MKHLRKIYDALGVEKYYRIYANQYSNPHLIQVQQLLKQNESFLDYSSVLDFCAGGGEVNQFLKSLNYQNFNASDPFTYELYKKNLNQPCFRWSFDDVIKGKIKGEYSCIICSFAMHLCPAEKLYPLVIQLFQHSKTLVIITPHKRPVLEELNGVELIRTDYAKTEKGKKVFLKVYKYVYLG